MQTSWTIRAACVDDAATIARHRYYRDEPQSDVDTYEVWLRPRIELAAYIGVVAECAGTVVAGAGALALDWGPTRGDPAGTRARVVNVFTEERWRRQGLARALVEQVMAICASRGVRSFNLAATADAQSLYRSLGFAPYANEMTLLLSRPPSLSSLNVFVPIRPQLIRPQITLQPNCCSVLARRT